MKEMNCCLTLVCHRSAEERLIDHLIGHPEWVRGFSGNKIEGHSQKENLPSMMDRIGPPAHLVTTVFYTARPSRPPRRAPP